MEREPVEHLTQCHLRRGDAVGLGDLPGDGRPERSDALHELGGGIGYVHARLDCLTLSGQVSDGARRVLRLARGLGGDSPPLGRGHARVPEKPV